jgi:hypothetical protein
MPALVSIVDPMGIYGDHPDAACPLLLRRQMAARGKISIVEAATRTRTLDSPEMPASQGYRRGRLPRVCRLELRLAPGKGERCDGCEEPISHEAMAHHAEIAGTITLSFHEECFARWIAEL